MPPPPYPPPPYAYSPNTSPTSPTSADRASQLEPPRARGLAPRGLAGFEAPPPPFGWLKALFLGTGAPPLPYPRLAAAVAISLALLECALLAVLLLTLCSVDRAGASCAATLFVPPLVGLISPAAAIVGAAAIVLGRCTLPTRRRRRKKRRGTADDLGRHSLNSPFASSQGSPLPSPLHSPLNSPLARSPPNSPLNSPMASPLASPFSSRRLFATPHERCLVSTKRGETPGGSNGRWPRLRLVRLAAAWNTISTLNALVALAVYAAPPLRSSFATPLWIALPLALLAIKMLLAQALKLVAASVGVDAQTWRLLISIGE